MTKNWPIAFKRQKIGLLGGSFDPAHSGHLHVAQTAMKNLNLDFVWWLVSPQNPLKQNSSHINKRIESAKTITKGYKMVVTNIETNLKTQFTLDTILALKRHYKNVHFVWLMGADNLYSFEKWKNWQNIIKQVPICIISRPSAKVNARLGRLARQFANYRIPINSAKTLAVKKSPSWVYINAPFNPISSTLLRRKDAN